MPTLEEMINLTNLSSQNEPKEPVRRTVWQQIKNEWPPFIPPSPPLTLERVWQYVVLDDPAPPTAVDLATEAAEEVRCYPECHNAMYRRSHPDWLERDVAFYTELSRERRWQEIERYLNDGGDLSQERRSWMLGHADLIRPLVEEAKAEHRAHYGEGWLKRALARIAERRRP
jgi:hypothetical protein